MVRILSRKKFVVTVLLAAMLMFGGITAYADTFLSPQPFEIWSEDGTMVFRWDPGPEDNWSRTAQAAVYRNGDLVYSVQNLPITGVSASNFLFSADLRYFVFRPTVSQVMALGFFEDGVLLQAYRIDELVRDMSVATYSVTTAAWENWRDRYFDAVNNTLTIVTRDDITYVFDITTGGIIYDTAGDAPFIPHAENTWGYFVNKDMPPPLWADVSISEDESLSSPIPMWRRLLAWGIYPLWQ